jgi:hypothetical protein
MPEGKASVKVASDRPVTPPQAVPQTLLDVGRDLFPEPHLDG